MGSNISPNFSEKKVNFANNFPRYLTENTSILDAKHKNIIDKIEISEDWLTAFREEDIRCWGMQNDLGQPAYLRDYLQRKGPYLNNFIKFIYHKVKFREVNKQIKDSLVDDISIIQNLYGHSFLKENPVDQTPGNPEYCRIKGYKVNTRWMRYLYLANTIVNKGMLSSEGIWLDIGSYYGGLQGLVYKYNKNSKIILVDFHHQLFRSYAYLSKLYPNAIHNLGIEKVLTNNTIPSFNYVHISDFSALNALNIKLLTNFFSFGEMKREIFDNYVSSEVVNKAEMIYIVNRFVSAPFFEKTYDNDLTVLDYKFPNHKVSYFNIFPIHHFATFPRTLFEKTRPRNTGSSYFESILDRRHS